MRAGIIVLTVIALASAGCARDTTPPPRADSDHWREATTTELAGSLKMQRKRALAAVDTMSSRLGGALHEALDRGGPAEAIAVCRSVAPAVAADVGEEYGLTIGRTSFALRNPDNTPPGWATGLIAARRAEPAFLVGPHGELGALLPIRVASECQMCHGPASQISGETRAMLRRYYPDDRATGFSAGDLRGWFWVVAPPVVAGDG